MEEDDEIVCLSADRSSEVPEGGHHHGGSQFRRNWERGEERRHHDPRSYSRQWNNRNHGGPMPPGGGKRFRYDDRWGLETTPRIRRETVLDSNHSTYSTNHRGNMAQNGSPWRPGGGPHYFNKPRIQLNGDSRSRSLPHNTCRFSQPGMPRNQLSATCLPTVPNTSHDPFQNKRTMLLNPMYKLSTQVGPNTASNIGDRSYGSSSRSRSPSMLTGLATPLQLVAVSNSPPVCHIRRSVSPDLGESGGLETNRDFSKSPELVQLDESDDDEVAVILDEETSPRSCSSAAVVLSETTRKNPDSAPVAANHSARSITPEVVVFRDETATAVDQNKKTEELRLQTKRKGSPEIMKFSEASQKNKKATSEIVELEDVSDNESGSSDGDASTISSSDLDDDEIGHSSVIPEAMETTSIETISRNEIPGNTRSEQMKHGGLQDEASDISKPDEVSANAAMEHSRSEQTSKSEDMEVTSALNKESQTHQVKKDFNCSQEKTGKEQSVLRKTDPIVKDNESMRKDDEVVRELPDIKLFASLREPTDNIGSESTSESNTASGTLHTLSTENLNETKIGVEKTTMASSKAAVRENPKQLEDSERAHSEAVGKENLSAPTSRAAEECEHDTIGSDQPIGEREEENRPETSGIRSENFVATAASEESNSETSETMSEPNPLIVMRTMELTAIVITTEKGLRLKFPDSAKKALSNPLVVDQIQKSITGTANLEEGTEVFFKIKVQKRVKPSNNHIQGPGKTEEKPVRDSSADKSTEMQVPLCSETEAHAASSSRPECKTAPEETKLEESSQEDQVMASLPEATAEKDTRSPTESDLTESSNIFSKTDDHTYYMQNEQSAEEEEMEPLRSKGAPVVPPSTAPKDQAEAEKNSRAEAKNLPPLQNFSAGITPVNMEPTTATKFAGTYARIREALKRRNVKGLSGDAPSE